MLISFLSLPFCSSWQQTDRAWASRWENYLYHSDDKVHIFSVINSLIMVFFLTFMTAIILLRSLRKDLARYNSDPLVFALPQSFPLETTTDDFPFKQEDTQEEYGWKLVHGDVFRTPKRPMMLAILAGNGVQLTLMAFTTICLAIFGFLSPSSRGSLVTVAIVFYMCFGFAAGYTSARLYKMFGGESWKKSVFLTATLVPGTISVILTILNFFLVGYESSAALPFPTLVGLLAMWILISCPLCFLGSFFGFRKQAWTRLHPFTLFFLGL